jgi:hypothetical protein
MTEMQFAGDDASWARLTSLTEVDPEVGRSWLDGLVLNRSAPVDLLLTLLDLGKVGVVLRSDVPEAVKDVAVVHPSRDVRRWVSEFWDRLSAAQWERLKAASPEPFLKETAEEALANLRLGLLNRPGVQGLPRPDAVPPRTPEEIAARASEVPDIGPDHRSKALWWIAALHADADAMRQLAGSPKLLVRRSVARAPRLPADVAALLARDDDRVVRLFLAESCDDAPPDMLLEVAAWWGGSLTFWGRPRNHPNFPRDGLLRFATDPNPLLRVLALDDPASTAAVAERLSGDPEASVRMAAAEDRRLPPEVAVRLASDPDRDVRWRAQQNPVLPTDELVTLLLEQCSAKTAAGNPAIPVPVMHHMLALAMPLPDHR